MEFRPVKGMNDILPDEVERWHRLENTFRRTAELHGYSEIRTPLLERTELFVRSIGDTTDVVEKQMFTLQQGDESLALRPEGTAGVARAYVTHTVHAREPVSRWYYIGPMFRAERPQRGRYRQFHQAGCEIFGDTGPLCDAELIDMLCTFLGAVGITGLEVRINSLGSLGTRDRYRNALRDYLRPNVAALSDHAKLRLEDNPLRILDSKDPRDQAAVQGAPSILDLLEPEDRAHWDALCAGLDKLGTPYRIDPTLVRGLDYYTRTLFEISSSTGELGAQNTLLGGGRYDGMVKDLGGPAVPAVGFAMGLERLLLAMPPSAVERAAFCYLAPLGGPAQEAALVLGRDLRRAGLRADVDGRGGTLRSMLRRADASGAKVCLVLGTSELERGVVQVKDLVTHMQEELPLGEVVSAIAARLAASPPPSTTETGGGA